MDDFDYESGYRKLTQELAWIHKLMRNEKMRSDEKVSLYEAKYEHTYSEKDEDGYARIFVWKIADETGLSTDKAGKSLKLLADHGVLDRRLAYVTNERTGQVEKAVFIRLTDVARNPSLIALPQSGHGGKRTPRCESCGNDSFVEKVQRICTQCGTVHESWRTIEPKGETEDA